MSASPFPRLFVGIGDHRRPANAHIPSSDCSSSPSRTEQEREHNGRHAVRRIVGHKKWRDCPPQAILSISILDELDARTVPFCAHLGVSIVELRAHDQPHVLLRS